MIVAFDERDGLVVGALLGLSIQGGNQKVVEINFAGCWTAEISGPVIWPVR
jgi:hypothetical protein